MCRTETFWKTSWAAAQSNLENVELSGVHPSHLGCSPDTVYVLCAKATLRSQEVQDHLALFNDLENKHVLDSERKHCVQFLLVCCVSNLQKTVQSTVKRSFKISFLFKLKCFFTSMCKLGPKMCSTTLFWISQSASSFAMDLKRWRFVCSSLEFIWKIRANIYSSGHFVIFECSLLRKRFFRSNQLGMDKKKKKSDQTLQKQNAILAIWISYL